MELDDELHSLTIGDSTIMESYIKIKFVSYLLSNICSSVNEQNLVIYALNGLPPKFYHIVTTIRHEKPFPAFLEMHSMLTLEEQSMNKERNRLVQSPHLDTPSAPTILNTQH